MKPPIAAALAEALEKTAYSLMQLHVAEESKSIRAELAKTIGPAARSLLDVAKLLSESPALTVRHRVKNPPSKTHQNPDPGGRR